VTFSLRQSKKWGKAAGNVWERTERGDRQGTQLVGAGGSSARVEAGEGTWGWGIRLGGPAAEPFAFGRPIVNSLIFNLFKPF
jgi:hypothetical protein